MRDKPLIRVDASTWQRQLETLIETMAQKVLREADKCIAGPPYLSPDLFFMLRYSAAIYKQLHYLIADERRQDDCYWRNEYAIVAFTNIRSLIDCLYNVTYILQNPSEHAKLYRSSGLYKLLLKDAEERDRYGTDPDWTEYLSKSKARIENTIRISAFDSADLLSTRPKWITMGTYLSQMHGKDNAHSSFLRTFTYGPWRQYSNLSHLSLEGLLADGQFFIRDSLPHDMRPDLDAYFPQIMTMHVARAAALLLCTITELQAYCRFDDARINERIQEIWTALLPLYEVKELYAGRYKLLMEETQIWRDAS